MPSTSVRLFMVVAVPIVLQYPVEGGSRGHQLDELFAVDFAGGKAFIDFHGLLRFFMV